MMAEEQVSIQKNEYKELSLQSVALFPRLVHEPLSWIRSAFDEDLKVMLSYMQLKNISTLTYEAGLVAPWT